jgi:CO/xanthine dehydrogenase Mo-binding subunit
VHDDAPDNKCYRFEYPCGDIDAALNGADVVVERRFYQNRLIPTAIEPRAVVAVPASAAGEVTLYSATQIPHVLRVLLALITGTPGHKLRVVAPDVGGGFGSKLNVYAEEVLCLQIARKLGRPIKWTETRSEGYQATIHGREMIQDIKIAADRDGRLRGLHVDLTADMGAYLQLVTPGIPILGTFMYNAIYKMDAYSFNTTTRGVPVHHGLGPDVRLGQLRGRDRQGSGAVRLRRAARRAAETPRVGRPRPTRHRHLDLHRSLRHRAVARARLVALRRRGLGDRNRPRDPHRQGRGRDRDLAPRPRS